MNIVYLSSAYLAPIEYYVAMIKADEVFLEACEHYEKQSYRNRCNIIGANGRLALTIPVEKSTNGRQKTIDVRISEHSDWQINHWRSIESAYNSTPFFEYYKDDLLPFYEKKWRFLFDFNLEIQTKIIELLDIELVCNKTHEYKQFLIDGMDFRETIHPKKVDLNLVINPYYQVFEQRFGFCSNLSIIDLLFNMGNESILVLNK